MIAISGQAASVLQGRQRTSPLDRGRAGNEVAAAVAAAVEVAVVHPRRWSTFYPTTTPTTALEIPIATMVDRATAVNEAAAANEVVAVVVEAAGSRPSR